VKKLITVGLFLFGCDHTQRTNELLPELIYIRDNRTGLCFASRYLGHQAGVMTNVPCTPEVERLIK
jgi:hypothetical protein